ncbi:Cof-type HAD-IIB family hydrolase [Thalassobacillus hwangdonensis]|uniref:Cof-type HAD-IIB family hydrolase n=1 Tax=Thalassobacillus hwangdonensis TaxID=546108 RepID=A0ABW3KWF4_9BACI
MHKKIAFFDIDGTLLDHDKKLSQETIDTIKQLQEKGVYCAIATGRAPFMFEPIREKLGIDSFISFNGQYVVFEGEVIYENPLEKEKLEALYKEAARTGHPMVFMNHEEMKASTDDHPFINESLGSLYFDHPDKDEAFFEKGKIYQSLLFCEGDEIETYRADHEGFDFIRWHQYSCDVLPGGGSKAEGIKKMVEAAGLRIEDSYAFGDGLNDKEMLQEAGTGVAMGNAAPEVKALADYVTDDVAERGLVKAIHEVGLLD